MLANSILHFLDQEQIKYFRVRLCGDLNHKQEDIKHLIVGSTSISMWNLSEVLKRHAVITPNL